MFVWFLMITMIMVANMTLLDMRQDKTYRIKSVYCTQDSLAQRLHSLGIYEGVEVQLGHISIWQHTYSIYVNGAQVALRKNEAALIEIEAL